MRQSIDGLNLDMQEPCQTTKVHRPCNGELNFSNCRSFSAARAFI